MPSITKRASSRRPADPPESWELEYSESEGAPYNRGVYDVFPRPPRSEEDVPQGALEALNSSCSLAGLRQLLLLPMAVRATGHGGEKVISPASVLAIGTRAVGLWTDRPQAGVKVLIPLERMSAIEDVTILLYGRLSFFSFSERLTIRYNTLARSSLKPVLFELRQRLAGSPLPLPHEEAPAGELPLKWRRLLRSPQLRFREGAPLAYRFTVTPRSARDDIERGQLLVLSPHELLFLCDPPEASHNYGEDSFIVPRPRITRVRVRERYLEVASNGARLSLSMAPELRQAAARWLS